MSKPADKLDPKQSLAKLNGLNLKESQFVRELLANKFNATEAARKSYDVSSDSSARAYACEVLKKERVQVALADYLAQEGINTEWVIKALKKEVEREADSPQERAVRIRALELIGKHLGAFKERIEVNHAPEPLIVIKTSENEEN
jgi:3-methyladenine DNA glycosylase AlkC